MTEAKWLTCGDPWAMLGFVAGRLGERKLRLFACGLWRHSEHLRLSHDELSIVEEAEGWADGLGQWKASGRRYPHLGVDAATGPAAAEGALRAYEGRWVRWMDMGMEAQWAAVRAPVCRLLRDIAGNPCRPVAFSPAWLTWHGGLLVSMARRMYESRDFTELPVLADMLEDAGCADEQILAHCRAGGRHARGCFAVDPLLGRE